MPSSQVVREIIAQLFDVDEEILTGDRTLASIGWDSVQAMRVLMYLEREFGAPIDFDRFMSAKSIGDLSELVQVAAGDDAPEQGSP
jgi:acyl carrier protein